MNTAEAGGDSLERLGDSKVEDGCVPERAGLKKFVLCISRM